MKNVLFVITMFLLTSLSTLADELQSKTSPTYQCTLSVAAKNGIDFYVRQEYTKNVSSISFSKYNSYYNIGIDFKVFSESNKNSSILELENTDKNVFISVDLGRPEITTAGTISNTSIIISSYLNGEHGAGKVVRAINWYVLGIGYITLDSPSEMGTYSVSLICK